jgi:hydroxymethylbilane synthase
MRALRAATRGSHLARWQTSHVGALLRKHWRGDISDTVIETKGDVSLAERLAGQLEKGFFTEELEDSLRRKDTDFAVHSLKDLPTADAPGLTIAAVLPRADCFDLLLVAKAAVDLTSPGLPLNPGATIGTSSLRRHAQIQAMSSQARAVPLRGNVPTRLKRLAEGHFDSIILAAAGVRRLELDLSAFQAFELDPARWPCAPGQGAVAVQCREDDAELRAVLAHLNHAETERATRIERKWLAVLEGGCSTPFGCWVDGETAYMGLAQPHWRADTVKPAELSTPEMESFLQTLSSHHTSSSHKDSPDAPRQIARAV